MRLSVGSLRQVVERDAPIEFIPQQLTSYGSLELFRRYGRPLTLPRRVRAAWAALGGDYSGAHLGLLVLALLYVGARRLEHLRYLAGGPLTRRFCGPGARTVGNWLRRFTQETLRPLVQLNQELVLDTLTQVQIPGLTLDVDGTVVRTGPTVAWAFRGFNPHQRKDRSDYPLLAHATQTVHILGLKNRQHDPPASPPCAPSSADWARRRRRSPSSRASSPSTSSPPKHSATACCVMRLGTGGRPGPCAVSTRDRAARAMSARRAPT